MSGSPGTGTPRTLCQRGCPYQKSVRIDQLSLVAKSELETTSDINSPARRDTGCGMPLAVLNRRGHILCPSSPGAIEKSPMPYGYCFAEGLPQPSAAPLK